MCASNQNNVVFIKEFSASLFQLRVLIHSCWFKKVACRSLQPCHREYRFQSHFTRCAKKGNCSRYYYKRNFSLAAINCALPAFITIKMIMIFADQRSASKQTVWFDVYKFIITQLATAVSLSITTLARSLVVSKNTDNNSSWSLCTTLVQIATQPRASFLRVNGWFCYTFLQAYCL